MIGTLAEFRAHHTERGNDAPGDATDANATAALVRASDYIETVYLNRVSTAVPDAIKEKATYIAGGQEIDTPGFWSKTYSPDQQKVLTQAGDIRWTPVGSASGSDAATPRSTMIEGLLRPYMIVTAGALVL